MTDFFADKRVTVTGGAGFLGSHVVDKLRQRGCREIFVPEYPGFDFTKENDILRMFAEAKPDIIIHLAAAVGGIGANTANPGRFFYENLIMGANLIEQSRLHDVKKFVAIGTICCYPKHTPVPFKEENLWDGYPAEATAPYGLAKKMMLVHLQCYRQQYGFNGIFIMPVNLYGPRDNFNDLENSHVVPALIRKCLEAKQRGDSSVEVWGTGNATREFLYANDAAEGILLATEHYNEPEPVNLGSGREIPIRDLVQIIADLIDFKGKIRWDTSKPDGQPRRCLDTTKAKHLFGFEARTSLEEGLRKTIEWYVNHIV